MTKPKLMVMIATITACFITNSGRSAWFIGALLLFIYLIFAMTLPFAILGNVFRVFTIILVSKWFGSAAGTGPWHDISGFVVTIPIAVMAMIWFGELLDRDWSGVKEKLLARDAPRVTSAASPSGAEGEVEKPASSASPISYDY